MIRLEPLRTGGVWLFVAVWHIGFVSYGHLPARDARADTDQSTQRMWTTGDAENLYLLWGESREEKAGFNIFHRQKAKGRFLPGPWYAGQPLTVGVRDHRVWVFLAQGGCQSYDLNSTHTEPRLPAGLQAISCAGSPQGLVVLAQARQELTVKVSSDLTAAVGPAVPAVQLPETQKAPNADHRKQEGADGIVSGQAAGVIALQRGDLVALAFRAGVENQWVSLHLEPLAIRHWYEPAIGSADGVVHVFGMGRLAGDRGGRDASLLHCRLEKGRWSQPRRVAIDHVTGFKVITVNRQLRLITAVGSKKESPDENAPPATANHYRLGLYSQQTWLLSEPLEKAPGVALTGPIHELAFAPLDQNIAVFQQDEGDVIRFRAYSSQGALLANLAETISLKDLPEESLFSRLLDPRIEMFVLMCVLMLLFWRREEAFSRIPAIENEIQLAPLWRRGAAFLLDVFPAACLSLPIMVKLFPEMVSDPAFSQTVFQSLSSENGDPAIEPYIIASFFCLSWTLVVYLTVCEVFFATTPGKRVLSIRVIDHQGRRPGVRQAVTRNVIRLLEWYGNLIFIVLVLLFFTNKRQRLGDLLARTLVVMKHRPPPKQPENQSDSPSE